MDENDKTEGPRVGRRTLLRGGAAAATVAGLGVTAAVAAPAAAAEPVTPVALGAANAETTTTSLTVAGSVGDPAVPALTLVNDNGPALALNTLAADWNGTLKPGQVAATTEGLLVGTATGTTPVLTAEDLLAFPTTLPLPPFRLLDLRRPAGRERIAGSSPNAFDAAGRLKGGAYVDVAVGLVDPGIPLVLDAFYGNVTGTGSSASGYLTCYPPDGQNRPDTSTLNWAAGQTIANMVFVGATAVGSHFVVRILTTATTFVVLDCTGVVVRLEGSVGAAAVQRAPVTPQSLTGRARRLLGLD